MYLHYVMFFGPGKRVNWIAMYSHYDRCKEDILNWSRLTAQGGHFYLNLDIILVKTKTIKTGMRVVFQDQAMFMHASFRGVKASRIGRKKCFWSSLKMLQVKKKHEKTLGSIFIPGKYPGGKYTCFGRSFGMRMISNPKYMCPPFPPGWWITRGMPVFVT